MEPTQKATAQDPARMYYVALVLPQDINEQVLEWKEFFRDRYGCTVALKSPAHITLVPPHWMPVAAETELIHQIDLFAQVQSSFPLSTRGFSSFKPRTIFVAVQHSEALQQLKQNLDGALTAHPTLNIKKEHRPFHPHITLATRDLQKHQYFEAWPLFKNKAFNMDWKVNGISLLRHNGRHWDVWHTAAFGDGRIGAKSKL